MSPSKLVALMHGASSKNRRDLEDEMYLSDRLHCLYIDYCDIRSFLDELQSTTVDEGKLNRAAYGALRNMAEAQLSFGCGAFMVSPIEPDEYRAHLDGLVALADAYGVPLTVVEVRREPEEDESDVKVNLNDIPHLIVHLGDSEHLENRCASGDIDFFPLINDFVQYFDSMPEFDGNCGPSTPESSTFRHFSHRHPLLLKSSDLSNVEKTDHCCSVCTASITGQPFHTCLCCGFFLHKQCAELPQHVKSSIHSHHLRLVIASWEKSGSGSRLFHYRSYLDSNPEYKITCLVCDSEEKLPFYGCFHCPNLFIHHKCIRSLQHVIQHRAHPHPLTMEMTETYSFIGHDYRCYACGGAGNKISYRCRECNFYFHVKCVLSLPPYIRHERHKDHPLHLSMPPKDETNEYYCEVCAERRHPDYWIYYCRDCEYEAHPHCVLQGIHHYSYKEEQEGDDDVDVNDDQEERERDDYDDGD